MRIAKESTAAQWIATGLHPFATDVGAIIPEGFEAYARVLHPAYRRTEGGTRRPVRWRDIMVATGQSMADELQRFAATDGPTQVTVGGVQLWDEPPACGCAPLETITRLIATLGTRTQTPTRCWFAVWEGWGGLDLDDDVQRAPVVTVPHRDLRLFEGTVQEAAHSFDDIVYQSANLWWPDDRAWCVVTEIDFGWTYVGGTTGCIAALLNDPGLEALPTTPAEGNFMER